MQSDIIVLCFGMEFVSISHFSSHGENTHIMHHLLASTEFLAYRPGPSYYLAARYFFKVTFVLHVFMSIQLSNSAFRPSVFCYDYEVIVQLINNGFN